MKIMSWNVNSVRVRHARLLGVLERHAPDVLCLQELKTEDKGFPFDALREVGYQAVTHGQKTYNGVALLTKVAPEDVLRGFDDDVEDPQARLIAARVDGVRVISAYVPNGGQMGSEKWAYKQAWYGRLCAWLKRHAGPDEPLALCGDFNVALDERDVANPTSWAETVLYHPDARAMLQGVLACGLQDTFRGLVAEGGHYSWWDYRAGAFPKNDGLRIDYILASPSLASRCTAVGIDREERKKIAARPDDAASDHVPVWAEFSAG